MTYKSLYYNLDRPGPYGDRDTFAWVVEQLETMSRNDLLALLEHTEIGIRFTAADWRDTVSHEDLVSVLVSDVRPTTMLRILRARSERA